MHFIRQSKFWFRVALLHLNAVIQTESQKKVLFSFQWKKRKNLNDMTIQMVKWKSCTFVALMNVLDVNYVLFNFHTVFGTIIGHNILDTPYRSPTAGQHVQQFMKLSITDRITLRANYALHFLCRYKRLPTSILYIRINFSCS